MPCQVLSGFPRGTVLGPTLFFIFINDLVAETKNHLTFYDNGFKLFGTADNSSLQADLDQVQAWAYKWILSFNISKCVTLHFDRGNPQHEFTMHCGKMSLTVLLPTSGSDRDLGLLLDDSLRLHEPITQEFSKATTNLGFLKRTTSIRSITAFFKTIQSSGQANPRFRNIPGWFYLQERRLAH